MKKYALVSTDCNPNYLFYLPLINKMWNYLGYELIVLYLNNNPKLIDVVFKYCPNVLKYEIHSINGYRDANLVQISRLFAGSLDLNPDDYILTSDIDMIPLCKQWFNQQDFNKAMHIFDANELNYNRHKICYVGTTHSIWKEMFYGTDINTSLNEFLSNTLTANNSWNDGWNHDETSLFKALKNSKAYNESVHFIERGGNQFGFRDRRIDRGAWLPTIQMYLTNAIDSHAVREPYNFWENLKLILTLRLDSNSIEELDRYKNEFITLL